MLADLSPPKLNKLLQRETTNARTFTHLTAKNVLPERLISLQLLTTIASTATPAA
jgi:hypothetical protein